MVAIPAAEVAALDVREPLAAGGQRRGPVRAAERDVTIGAGRPIRLVTGIHLPPKSQEPEIVARLQAHDRRGNLAEPGQAVEQLANRLCDPVNPRPAGQMIEITLPAQKNALIPLAGSQAGHRAFKRLLLGGRVRRSGQPEVRAGAAIAAPGLILAAQDVKRRVHNRIRKRVQPGLDERFDGDRIPQQGSQACKARNEHERLRRDDAQTPAGGQEPQAAFEERGVQVALAGRVRFGNERLERRIVIAAVQVRRVGHHNVAGRAKRGHNRFIESVMIVPQ